MDTPMTSTAATRTVVAPCAVRPREAKLQIQKVGNDLVQHYGKKKFYTVREVREANRRQHIDIDLCCWSHAFFNTHEDFDHLHQNLGEACDYAGMKSELVTSMAPPEDGSWFDFDWDLSWLELPDFDFSIFDFFDL
jgi:predicted Co/Zn/Cd cation transporter (cation efflux family)